MSAPIDQQTDNDAEQAANAETWAVGAEGAQPPAGGAARTSEWAKIREDPFGLLESIIPLGDVVLFHAGRRKSYVLIHPDHVKDALVTNHKKYRSAGTSPEMKRVLGNGLLHSDGDFHKRQRRLANPAFHHLRINSYAEIMSGYAEKLSQSWSAGRQVDLHSEITFLALRIVSKSLFDMDIDAPEAADFRAAVHSLVPLFRMGSPVSTLLRRLQLQTTKEFDDIKAGMDRLMYQVIEERRANPEDRGDIISMLLLSRDDDGDGSRMNDEQVRDEATTILVAGYETTANLLTWTFGLLSEHPEIEAKLHQEVDSVLGGRLPTMEDFASLPYTKKIITEALRLYPPAWILHRRVGEEHEVGGYTLPVGASVLMFPYLVHRDPRWWDEPKRFDPDRWTDELERERSRSFQYIPFGAGPRMCIGEAFAWMEATIVLTTLSQRWRPRVVPGHKLEAEALFNLRPKGGMPVVLEARSER
ncbi:MAG TPA: cytochrome P450 [Actinomycetota bacterium]|nr:cytochrome P450 [Actinomycetota bacterium]